MPNFIFSLQGAVQHYDWGGYAFIPNLIGTDNFNQQPFAELWMGAHPLAPSLVKQKNTQIPLNQYISDNPAALLGDKVLANFGEQLPFLFKILDVRKMLSIQSHPNKEQAAAGFKRENQAGIPLNAPNRTYRDTNHKPEVMVALTEFWLLHGFQSLAAISRTLQHVSELQFLLPLFSTQDISVLYRYLMELPQEAVTARLRPLEARLKARVPTDKTSPDYWAHKAFHDHTMPDGNLDRGIFSIYLFNIVHLQPGEGIYQGAGVPHAYMEGVNVELMANSDNVFRGGLTTKHIDVPELLKSLVTEPIEPNIITGEPLSETEMIYFTPATDFELSKITINANRSHQNNSVYAPEIFIVLEGEATVNEAQTFQKGEIFLATPGASYNIRSQQKTVLYCATVP
jgi:mannose-6-phosphate isomerase